jgi:hypothetical protein
VDKYKVEESKSKVCMQVSKRSKGSKLDLCIEVSNALTGGN